MRGFGSRDCCVWSMLKAILLWCHVLLRSLSASADEGVKPRNDARRFRFLMLTSCGLRSSTRNDFRETMI